MKKILSLGIKDWITGIGIGQHFEGSGLFARADGINPFVNPYLNSADFGLLQTGGAETDISGGVVDQVINTIIPRNQTYFYCLGATGDFYRVTIADNTVTQVTNGDSVVNLVNGFILNVGGTELLYYINDLGGGGTYTHLGTWDFSTTFDNDAKTGGGNTLNQTAFKPIHYWEKTHWIGNGHQIAKVDETGTLTLAALTLDRGYTVTAISDDGYRLIIAASTETAGTVKGQTKIYFWDGAINLPEKMFEVPEASVKALKKINGIIYIHAGKSLYVCNYATAPTKILDLDTDYTPANQKSVSRIGDALVWGGVDINMYGKINPRVPAAYTTPLSFALRAYTSTSINAEIKQGVIYVAATNAKLYSIPITSGNNPSGITKTATTHYIDLKDVYLIKGITLIFGLNLATGDAFDVTITNRNGDAKTVNALFSTHGAVSRIHFPISLKADQVKIAMLFQNNNPKIKDIILHGDVTPQL